MEVLRPTMLYVVPKVFGASRVIGKAHQKEATNNATNQDTR